MSACVSIWGFPVRVSISCIVVQMPLYFFLLRAYVCAWRCEHALLSLENLKCRIWIFIHSLIQIPRTRQLPLLTEYSRVGGDAGPLVDPVVVPDVKVDAVVFRLKNKTDYERHFVQNQKH